MKNALLRAGLLAAAFFLILSHASAWAVQFPEPKSGGKFFPGKGTRAAQADAETISASRPYLGKGFDLGAIHLRPFAEYNAEYDDNVLLTENDEQDDFINRVRAGAGAEVPIDAGRHLLYGSYTLESEFFDEFDSEDHDDHSALVGAQLNFVPFTVAVEDNYRITNNRTNTEFNRRVERDENVFDAQITVPFAAFFVETEVIDNWVDYQESPEDAFDHNEAAVFPRIGFNLGPNTQILGEYGYTDISYDSNDARDGSANEGSVGLRGRFTERTSYQAWVGYQSRVYDLDQNPDFNDIIARGQLDFDISEASTLTLRGGRRAQETTFLNQTYYIDNSGELLWRQQFADRWFFNTREIIHFNEYSNDVGGENREDTVWQAGAGLEYVMPNDIVSLLLEYRHRSRDSSEAGLDYDSNVVTAGVRAAF